MYTNFIYKKKVTKKVKVCVEAKILTVYDKRQGHSTK